jgi:hypothetical protein
MMVVCPKCGAYHHADRDRTPCHKCSALAFFRSCGPFPCSVLASAEPPSPSQPSPGAPRATTTQRRRSTMPADEIDVMALYDDGDEHVEFVAKGHVDRSAFLSLVNEQWGRRGAYRLEDVQHEWRRAVPDPSGDKVCVYHPAVAGSRGATRMTVIDANAKPAPGSDEGAKT